MASRDLVDYIRKQINLGYKTSEIKLELVKRGHKASDVNAAIKEAEKTAKKGFPVLWVLLTIILAVAIVVFFVLLKLMAPVEEIPPSEVPIVEPEIPVTPEIPPSEVPEIPSEIPEEIPEEPPAEYPVVPEAPPVQVYTHDIPRTRYNLTQRIEFIRSRSLDNPEGAVILCSELQKQEERDICYLTISKSTADQSVCARISDLVMKDECFLYFAALGRDVCERIKDSATKKYCSELINVNRLLANSTET